MILQLIAYTMYHVKFKNNKFEYFEKTRPNASKMHSSNASTKRFLS